MADTLGKPIDTSSIMTLTPLHTAPSTSEFSLTDDKAHKDNALVANASILSEVAFIEDRLQGGWKPAQVAYFLRQNPKLIGTENITPELEDQIFALALDVSSIHRVALDAANVQVDDFRPSLNIGQDLLNRFKEDPAHIDRVVSAHSFMVDAIATNVRSILERGGELGGLNGLGHDIQLGAFKWLSDGSIDMRSPLQKEFVKDLIGRALLHDTTAGKIRQSKREPLRTGENTPNGGWYAAFAVIAVTALLAMYMRSNAESIAPGSTGSTDSEEAVEEQALGNAEAPVEVATEEPVDEAVQEIPATDEPVYDQGVEDLQMKLADKSNGFVVMKGDGSLVEVINGAEYSIPGVYGIDDNGKLALVVDSTTGDTLELEENQWFVDEFGLVVPGYLYNYQSKQWEKVPVKEFGSGPLEEYRSNVISPEDLYNGAYCAFVKRAFPHTFVKGEYKELQMNNYGTRIGYDSATAPNFPPGTVTPFYWKETAAYMKVGDWEYMVIPVQYPNPNPELASNPEHNICIPAIAPLNNPRDVGMNTLPYDKVVFDMFENDIFAPDFQTITYHFSHGTTFPFLEESYSNVYGVEVMNGKFQSFVNGNNRGLEGTPVTFLIKDSDYNK